MAGSGEKRNRAERIGRERQFLVDGSVNERLLLGSGLGGLNVRDWVIVTSETQRVGIDVMRPHRQADSGTILMHAANHVAFGLATTAGARLAERA